MSAIPQPMVDQAAQEGVPILFKDGSKGMVPRNKVLDLVKSGDGQVAHYMQFPDGSHDYVAHENVTGAMADGGKVMDPSAVRQRAEADPHPLTLGEGASIAGTTALVALPALGSSGKALRAAKAAADVEGITPSLSALFKTAVSTAKEADVAAGTVESAGAGKFVAIAAKGLQQAVEEGNTAKQIAYKAAMTGGQAYGKFSAMSTWLDKTVPGLPLGLKALAFAQLASDGYHKLFGDDNEDARKQLFGEK